MITLHEMTLAALRTREPEVITEAIDIHLQPLETVVAGSIDRSR